MRRLVEPGHGGLSVVEQCKLLELPRSSYYYEPTPESPENLALMRLIDEQYLATPCYGSRQMTQHLVRMGLQFNRKRVRRLMRIMGLEGIFPGKKTTIRASEHKVYPYLLRGLEVDRSNQVWCSDITYVPLRHGYMYLVAIMDWFSRHVLSWRLSNSLESTFCVEALNAALTRGCPDIFNTDQGSQFTSEGFTAPLIAACVAISMDGRGRALDNVFIERLWRSVKYEDIYLKDYATGADLMEGLTSWFDHYTHRRPHQGLGGRTPFEAYHGIEPPHKRNLGSKRTNGRQTLAALS